MATNSSANISAQMQAALAVAEPGLDTGIGSIVRKILDVVAEQLSASSADNHLLDYQYDINSKSGADLDDFVLLFGFNRLAARRATGIVTFSRPTAADQDYFIPINTQISSATTPNVVFATAAPATLFKATTSVDVPIICVSGGQVGNLASGLITRLSTPIGLVDASTNNANPTTGGTDDESDFALRERFKKTVFRSMAGTEDMFLGVALENTSNSPSNQVASQAVVIGATKRWRGQVQIAGDGSAVATIPASSVKYVFPGTSIVGADISGGNILTPGTHYTFNAGVNPPVINSIGTGLTVGGIYDFEFEYTPSASRNDPATGITNRVDIWVNGSYPVAATETSYLRTARVFVSTPTTDPLYNAKYVRLGTYNTAPTVGNYFIQLGFGPLISLPTTLTVAGNTYTLGTHYWGVQDDSAFGYGPTSLFGLEWLSTGTSPAPPIDASAISLSGSASYSYNRLPSDVEQRAKSWRLVGTDVRAHAAKVVLLRMNFAVIYQPKADRTQTDAAITAVIADYLSTKGFDASIQTSDILQLGASVNGVDAIRFLTGSEPFGGASSYAIERVGTDGTRISYYTSGSPAHAVDITFADNEVPSLYSINTVVKATNTFSTF